MGKYDDVFADIMSGKKDANIKFSDLCKLLENMGFRCSVRGDHYIYRRDDTPIIIYSPMATRQRHIR